MKPLTLLLALTPLALALPNPAPPPPSTEKITCFPPFHPGAFLSRNAAQNLINEFSRIACGPSPDTTPFHLNPFEGVTVTIGRQSIVFQNTLGKVAMPPDCGEVVEDFQELLEKCWPHGQSKGGILVETAGGGRTNYIISAF